jgi:hypothetical protein
LVKITTYYGKIIDTSISVKIKILRKKGESMKRCPVRLKKEEAKKASDAGLWATAQYAQHLIRAVKDNYERKPDMDSQNGMYAAYYFLKHIFADASAKTKEINLPELAKCFEVFNDMPADSVMEESLGMANPKIPQEEMVETLKKALDKAREQSYLARFAMDMGVGLLYDNETDVIYTISDVAGIPAKQISLETIVDDLNLSDEQLLKISKMLAENYGLDDDFLVDRVPETVGEIVDMITV